MVHFRQAHGDALLGSTMEPASSWRPLWVCMLTLSWLLAMCGFVVITATLFTPAYGDDATATSAASGTEKAKSSKPLRLDFVPPNPEFFVAVRPNELFNRELLKIFARYMNLDGQNYHPVPLTKIEQVTFVTEHLEEGQTRAPSTLRFDLHMFISEDPIDWAEFKANANFDYAPVTLHDEEYLKIKGHNNVAIWPADDRIYIGGPEEAIRRVIERRASGEEKLAIPTAWPGVGASQLAMVMDSEELIERFDLGGNNSLRALKGMLTGSDTFAMALHMDESSSLPMNMRLIFGCADEEMLPEKMKSLGGLSFLLKQMIMSQKKAREASGLDKQSPAFADAGAALFKNMTREEAGDTAAVLTLSADVEAALATSFLMGLLSDVSVSGVAETTLTRVNRAASGEESPMATVPPGVLNSPKMVARREASAQRMQKIVAAMQEHATQHGQLPTCSYDDQDRPLLSWRVHLLPALGYQDLYDKFDLEQPWDSEQNRKLLAEMPTEYGSPTNGADGAVGPIAAIFMVQGSNRGSAKTDNEPSNSIMLVEARRDVPWTQPNEVGVDSKGHLIETLRGWQPGGVMVCRADGSPQFILSADIAKSVFGAAKSEVETE